MIFQNTLINPGTITGIGLHSGKKITMDLHPAEPDTGVVFNYQGKMIKAVAENVVDTRLATVLGKDGVAISTVEHLLAALSVYGVDNVVIDINGPEVPILDGSAGPFVQFIRKAGVRAQKKRRKYLILQRAIVVSEGDKKISITPSPRLQVTFEINFDHPCIGLQSQSLEVEKSNFHLNIAPARTFGFLKDFAMLKKKNLALGGSMENAIVVDDAGVMNPGGLRFPDEFVRHKILDTIGDFSLLGCPMMGHIIASRSGHEFNQKVVKRILQRPECWKMVEFTEKGFKEYCPEPRQRLQDVLHSA